jgi:hypothetical protein
LNLGFERLAREFTGYSCAKAIRPTAINNNPTPNKVPTKTPPLTTPREDKDVAGKLGKRRVVPKIVSRDDQKDTQ